MKRSLFALALVALPVAGQALPKNSTPPPKHAHAKPSPHPTGTGKGKHCRKNCNSTDQKGLQP